jgi:hypothetical protein
MVAYCKENIDTLPNDIEIIFLNDIKIFDGRMIATTHGFLSETESYEKQEFVEVDTTLKMELFSGSRYLIDGITPTLNSEYLTTPKEDISSKKTILHDCEVASAVENNKQTVYIISIIAISCCVLILLISCLVLLWQNYKLRNREKNDTGVNVKFEMKEIAPISNVVEASTYI